MLIAVSRIANEAVVTLTYNGPHFDQALTDS